ncbi:hypothetical protein RJ640_014114 [Escallonia rubra]|uniref:Uncharacterized protein n=1 Tax=Escallonia rubra TaxID=112253 RepID=A0AA88QPB5_9ASTE|nr:hypothetical protein RJ640_014114 [Escallonia rubra]
MIAPFSPSSPQLSSMLLLAAISGPYKIVHYRSSFLCATVSSIVAVLGMLPRPVSRFLVKKSLGMAWSAIAVEALCTDVLQYHTVRNMLFMAMTEFKKLSSTPDWAFMREKRSQIAFLFGNNDHWGPLQIVEEISKQVPGAVLAIERDGHSHAFSCTEAGSVWVAQHWREQYREEHSKQRGKDEKKEGRKIEEGKERKKKRLNPNPNWV